MKLILASNNKHKIKEFKEILTNYEILGLKDIGFNEEIIEDGNTFEENALIKVKAVEKHLKTQNQNYLIVADDSGLCVESLNGAPGINSARFAGDHNDEKNRAKLLRELKDKENRDAYFECDIALRELDGNYKTFVGLSRGKISLEEKGTSDFGYDNIFYSNELNKTFGEVSIDEKNRVSHRGLAIKKLVDYLEK